MGKAIKYICKRGKEMSGNQKFVIGIIVAVCLALALAGALGGMQRTTSVSAAGGAAPLRYGQEGLRVSGTAIVRTAPEFATVRLGYESRGRRAREAKQKNDAVMRKIFAALGKSGIERKDIQTVEYRLFTTWESATSFRTVLRHVGTFGNQSISESWSKPTAKSIRVWHVTNMVEVRIRKVETAADVIDAASEAGAENISNVSFSVESLHELRAQAREKACKVAREKAEQLASRLGAKLGRPVAITDGNTRFYSPMSGANIVAQASSEMQAAPVASDPDSVISGGQIVVQATEEVVYSLE